MISKRMTRAEMIRWLGNAISTETEKPFDEIDYDFVDECGCLLDELMGKSDTMSEEEIADRSAKLKPETTSHVWKMIRHRNLRKIVIAAAVVLCMSVTVLAVPELRIKLMNALKLDVGESVEEDGVTFIHTGEPELYPNMNELISAENLNILSLEDLPDAININSIIYTENSSMTTITFNDPSINFVIFHNQNLIDAETKDNSEIFATDNFEAYLYKKDDFGTLNYNACFLYGNDTYIIRCTDEAILVSILNSITTGE